MMDSGVFSSWETLAIKSLRSVSTPAVSYTHLDVYKRQLFYRSSTLLIIGAALLGVSLLFQIVTLPVELDASRRALVILRESAMLEEAEIPMARAMLRAAAFTYVASVLSTLTQLLRILLLARGRDRR